MCTQDTTQNVVCSLEDVYSFGKLTPESGVNLRYTWLVEQVFGMQALLNTCYSTESNRYTIGLATFTCVITAWCLQHLSGPLVIPWRLAVTKEILSEILSTWECFSSQNIHYLHW